MLTTAYSGINIYLAIQKYLETGKMESHTKHPAIKVIVNEMSNVVNDKEYLHKGFGIKYR